MTCSSGMITWSWYIIIGLNYIIYLYKDKCIFIDYDSVQNGSNMILIKLYYTHYTFSTYICSFCTF